MAQTGNAPQDVIDYYRGFENYNSPGWGGHLAGYAPMDTSGWGGWYHNSFKDGKFYLNPNFTDSQGYKWMLQDDRVTSSGDTPGVEQGTYGARLRRGMNPGDDPGKVGGTDAYYDTKTGQFQMVNTDDPGWLNPVTGVLGVAGFALGANALFGGMGGGAAAGTATGLEGAGNAGLMYAGENAAAAGTLGGGYSVGGGAALGTGAAGAAGGMAGGGTVAGSGVPPPANPFVDGGAMTGAAGAGGSMAGITDFITPQTVGAVLGAVNANRGTESVQRAEPWAGVQPALLDLYGRGQGYMANPGGWPQYFPGSTVAPRGPTTGTAEQNLFNRASWGSQNMFGSNVLDAAQRQAEQTARGDYLGGPDMQRLLDMGYFGGLRPSTTSTLERIGAGEMLNANPYVDAMFNRAAGQVGKQFKNTVMPGIASMFSGAGRYGSEAMRNQMDTAQENFGSTLENLGTSIYGGNYANERGLQQQALGTLGGLDLSNFGQQVNALGQYGDRFGRERQMMMTAMGQAPNIAGADYTDLQAMMGLGERQDAFGQRQLDDQVARWNYNQQLPREMLGWYANLLNGAGNLGRTTTSSERGDPLAGALGGAMTMNSIFGGPRNQPVQQPIIRDSSWDSLFNSD